ncbi:MAG: hypothetical protein WC314_13355 [Vulcanimicrobiota bacterium]
MNISNDGVSGPLAASKPRRNKKATQVNIQRMCEVRSNKSIDEFSLSADGRYVAFTSDANNLVLGDTNRNLDVFVHDRQTAQTTRVSLEPGGAQAHSTSAAPSISADGRYVAFESSSSTLYRHLQNVFIHDRETGKTTLHW